MCTKIIQSLIHHVNNKLQIMEAVEIPQKSRKLAFLALDKRQQLGILATG